MRLVFLFLTTFGLLSPLIAQKKQPASNTLKPVDWQKEEMCQFVFFAVLARRHYLEDYNSRVARAEAYGEPPAL
mgnify:CR=1 FL=1